MTTLHVTEPALARVRELVRESNAKRPVLGVHWKQRVVDNKRGKAGEAVWTLVAEGHWDVGILDYEHPNWPDDLKNFPTAFVFGLEFRILIRDETGRPFQEATLNFDGRSFIVQGTAI